MKQLGSDVICLVFSHSKIESLMNKISDNNITLIEETHKYILASNPSLQFTSATTFIKYFFNPFDSIGIANNLTSSHPKYINMTPQELVKQWDKKAENGTIVHSEIEQFIKYKKPPTTEKAKLAIEWMNKNISDRYNILSEVIVYAEELEIAGTIDILLHDKEKDTYQILDWKTSERISTFSFKSKMGTHQTTSQLMDCNYIHYSLQLSLYQYILEKYYGLKITKRAIIHIADAEVITHESKYYKNEIENMFTADRAKLKKIAEDSLTKEFVTNS